MKISGIIRELEARAPAGTAEQWDNVGLLAGDSDWRTSGAVVTVDLTPQAIALAKANGYRLIINHHPCIFPKSRGLTRVVPSMGTSGLVFDAIRSGIAVFASHTNFDRCALEVVERVAAGLGVLPLGRLMGEDDESFLKLVVFVPESHLEGVRGTLAEAGAGHLGDYDSCSFSTLGEGTFRGGEGSRPFLGAPGRLEKVKEVRLETILPSGMRQKVLEALFRAHPYEEVAYDLLPLKQRMDSRGLIQGLGYGFYGDFPKPKSFPDLARDVKSLFKIDGFWMTDPVPKRLKRIAFVAGKGGSFLKAAQSAGCDLLITGEAGYHTSLDGVRRGIAVMELGHRESEKFFAPTVRNWLRGIGIKSIELNLATQRIHSGGKK